MFKGLAFLKTPSVALFFLITTAIFGIPVHAQEANLVEAAKKEGKVIAYTSMSKSTLKSIMRIFEKQYGIKGNFFRATTTTVMDRALTEYRANKVTYDLVITSKNPMRVMKEEGLFTRYVSPSSKYFEKKVVDPFFGPMYRSVIFGIVYNRNLIKEDQAPKSYQDLLDPKWKGKLTTSDPSRHTSTTDWFSSLHLLFGSEEKANAWIKGFAAQKPVLVRALRAGIRRIGSAESLLGIGYLHHVFRFGKEGLPLDYVKGLPGYLGEGHYVGLSSKAPHSNAAKLFIDFFLGEESMKIMAKSGEFVSRKGVYPPLPGADQVVKRFIPVVTLSKEEYARKKSEYRQIFKK